MTYYGITDTGKARTENQDIYDFREIPLKCTGGSALCAVVCDGMGGANGGKYASSLAIETFLNYISKQIEAFGEDISKPENIPLEKILRDGIKHTNNVVFTESVRNSEYSGMGTTLVAMLCIGETLYTVNVGDSRMYILFDGNLSQVTRDHSFVQTLVDSGSITPEQAKSFPEKNVILRAIGVSSTVEPDIFIIDGLPTASVLCSDGLSNMVSDNDIQSVLTSDISAKEMALRLVKMANDAGGTDNITASVVLFG